MTILATDVRFDDNTMRVFLEDGLTLGVPLAWFPRLLAATPEERSAATITAFGLPWETPEESISVSAFSSDAPKVAAE